MNGLPDNAVKRIFPAACWHTVELPKFDPDDWERGRLPFFRPFPGPPLCTEESFTDDLLLDSVKGSTMKNPLVFEARALTLVATIGGVKVDPSTHPAFTHAWLRVHITEFD